MAGIYPQKRPEKNETGNLGQDSDDSSFLYPTKEFYFIPTKEPLDEG